MKKILSLLLAALMLFSLTACNDKPVDNDTPPTTNPALPNVDNILQLDSMTQGTCNVEGTIVQLTEYDMHVNGEPMTQDDTQAVYRSFDMVYYEAGKGKTYGAGTEADEHTADEMAAYTVVNITKPGTYILNGFMSKGQVRIDLGETAKSDPKAVVTLYLNGVRIENAAAPCIIFQSVYECHTGEATQDVDTSAAGANVYICDGSVNILNGSYVAEIYDPETVVIENDEVISAETLYEYDGAFYSRMSMNIGGGEGYLTVNAQNEGICTEKHLTITGGTIHINAGNDGINTNEDGVSVTTINGGNLYITCTGKTGEGDGIDSNGWIVINDGHVLSQACAISGDAGVDADNGIHLNGGFVCATGNMLDAIAESEQNYAVFQFMGKQPAGEYALVRGNTVAVAGTVRNEFTYLVLSSEVLTAGEYNLTYNDEVLRAIKQDAIQMPGIDFNKPGMMPDVMVPGELITPPGDLMPPEEDVEIPPQPSEPPQEPAGAEGNNPDAPPEKPEGDRPTPPESDKQPPDDFKKPGHDFNAKDASETVVITDGANYFIVVSDVMPKEPTGDN